VYGADYETGSENMEKEEELHSVAAYVQREIFRHKVGFNERVGCAEEGSQQRVIIDPTSKVRPSRKEEKIGTDISCPFWLTPRGGEPTERAFTGLRGS